MAIDLNKLTTLDDSTIDASQIQPLVYPTEQYKIDNAYKLGKLHATNYYYGEERDEFWPTIVKDWNVNPYTVCRPGVYFAWVAGFTECYGNLLKEEGPRPDYDTN